MRGQLYLWAKEDVLCVGFIYKAADFRSLDSYLFGFRLK